MGSSKGPCGSLSASSRRDSRSASRPPPSAAPNRATKAAVVVPPIVAGQAVERLCGSGRRGHYPHPGTWLKCQYLSAQGMGKLVDGLYHRRRAEVLLEERRWDPQGWVDAGGGRSWRIPNISSLSRAWARVGSRPAAHAVRRGRRPGRADDAAGVFCCGLRVVSVDGSTTDVPATAANDEFFGRPGNATGAGAFPQVR